MIQLNVTRVMKPRWTTGFMHFMEKNVHNAQEYEKQCKTSKSRYATFVFYLLNYHSLHWSVTFRFEHHSLLTEHKFHI